MPRTQIASLSLKLIGIYALIQAIVMLRAVIHSFRFSSREPSMGSTLILGSLIHFALLIILGCLLIAASNRIAQRMIFPEAHPEDTKGFTSMQIQAIAFSILGVILIVLPIPKLFQIASSIYAYQKTSADIVTKQKWATETIWYGIGLAVQITISIVLFISGHSLANLWRKIVQRLKYEQNITSGWRRTQNRAA